MIEKKNKFETMVSVVIPTLNREKPLCSTLKYFLEIETYPNFELIVIDQSDCHDQVTSDYLNSAVHRMTYLKVNYKNVSKARNQGVDLARGEIILFVDDDVEPQHEFIAAHVTPYDDSKVMGVTGPSLSPSQSLKSRQDLLKSEYQSLLDRKNVRFDVDFAFDVMWAATCNVSFRKKIIQDLQGFNENLCGSVGFEDVEFCYRVEKTGGIIRYVPHARLVHHQASSGGNRNERNLEKYVYELAGNSYYLSVRFEFSIWRKCCFLWRPFRENVANCRVFRKKKFLALCWSFIAGILAKKKQISY